MLSGSEAVESAIKIARKWAYTKKGISEGEAWILTTDQCYHGLTLATMPLATVVAKSNHLLDPSAMTPSDLFFRLWTTRSQRWSVCANERKVDSVRGCGSS